MVPWMARLDDLYLTGAGFSTFHGESECTYSDWCDCCGFLLWRSWLEESIAALEKPPVRTCAWCAVVLKQMESPMVPFVWRILARP